MIVHYSDWAQQPDIRIACDHTCGSPAWGVPNSAPNVFTLDNGRLYTFDEPDVTCEACRRTDSYLANLISRNTPPSRPLPEESEELDVETRLRAFAIKRAGLSVGDLVQTPNSDLFDAIGAIIEIVPENIFPIRVQYPTAPDVYLYRAGEVKKL